MSSADARRSCHCSDYALWFDLLVLQSCCITMAAGGSSPALAAPVVHAVDDSLPALAAPDLAMTQLDYTLADALKYRYNAIMTIAWCAVPQRDGVTVMLYLHKGTFSREDFVEYYSLLASGHPSALPGDDAESCVCTRSIASMSEIV